MTEGTSAAVKIADVMYLTKHLGALLAGYSPEVQGAVLADLAATFIAGHADDVRDEVLQLHVEAIRELIQAS